MQNKQKFLECCALFLSLVQYLYKPLILKWFFKRSLRKIYNINYKQYMVILGKVLITVIWNVIKASPFHILICFLR